MRKLDFIYANALILLRFVFLINVFAKSLSDQTVNLSFAAIKLQYSIFHLGLSMSLITNRNFFSFSYIIVHNSWHLYISLQVNSYFLQWNALYDCPILHWHSPQYFTDVSLRYCYLSIFNSGWRPRRIRLTLDPEGRL